MKQLPYIKQYVLAYPLKTITTTKNVFDDNFYRDQRAYIDLQLM